MFLEKVPISLYEVGAQSQHPLKFPIKNIEKIDLSHWGYFSEKLVRLSFF